MDAGEREPPRENISDFGYASARGLISAVPGIGGLAAELMGQIVGPPIEERRRAWLISIAQRLEKLEAVGAVNLRELGESPQFVDCVLAASRAALASSREEKIDALRNAVTNCAIQHRFAEFEQVAFIRYIDEWSVWHIRVLTFLHDPSAALLRTVPTFVPPSLGTSLSALIRMTIKSSELDDESLSLVVDDLSLARLVSVRELATMMTSHGALGSRTTPRGQRFLKFIGESPVSP